MRRVLTLSLASMMMLGGFQAAPFGGVKVVKAQQADAKLEAIKADFQNFLNNTNEFYTIESPNANDTISGRVKITITDSFNYENNGKIEYTWLSLEEDASIISDSTDEDQKRKEYFSSSSNARKKQPCGVRIALFPLSFLMKM